MKSWKRFVAWLKSHMGVQVVDYTLSVMWLPKPLEPQHSYGFDIGPFFIALEKDGDVAHMLNFHDCKWQANWDWAWGVFKDVTDPHDDVQGPTYQYNNPSEGDREATLPPPPEPYYERFVEVQPISKGDPEYLRGIPLSTFIEQQEAKEAHERITLYSIEADEEDTLVAPKSKPIADMLLDTLADFEQERLPPQRIENLPPPYDTVVNSFKKGR